MQPFANELHFHCMNGLPEKSRSFSELKALVCAENFSNLTQSHFYISTGLIHLFVVSGAHLILLEKILGSALFGLRHGKAWLLAILTAYALACGLGPPIVRSLVALLLVSYLRSCRIHWPGHLTILIAGLTALFLHPPWITSLSLQLSWLAAFLVYLGSSFFRHHSALMKQSLLFTALFPTVVFFQVPEPATILINLLLAPVLEFVLFPAALIVWFFNFLYPAFDSLILAFRFILQRSELDFKFQTHALPSSTVFYNWLLIFLLHTIFHIWHIYKRRVQT